MAEQTPLERELGKRIDQWHEHRKDSSIGCGCAFCDASLVAEQIDGEWVHPMDNGGRFACTKRES